MNQGGLSLAAGKGPGTRTSAAERWLNHASMLLVGLSGVIYGVMKYLMEPDPDSFSVVNHPLQPVTLDIHVLSAPLLVFAIGLLARDHILRRLRNADSVRNRRTGILLCWGVLPMVMSGYLLQTVTNEIGLKVLVVIHLVSGGIFLFGYGAHAAIALVTRRRKAQLIAAALASTGRA